MASRHLGAPLTAVYSRSRAGQCDSSVLHHAGHRRIGLASRACGLLAGERGPAQENARSREMNVLSRFCTHHSWTYPGGGWTRTYESNGRRFLYRSTYSFNSFKSWQIPELRTPPGRAPRSREGRRSRPRVLLRRVARSLAANNLAVPGVSGRGARSRGRALSRTCDAGPPMAVPATW